jgi:UPF0042 nucleotide-binding protein
LFESFAYRHGVPGDADFVFDSRALPNPHWEPALKDLSGRDRAVAEFLARHDEVQRFLDDVTGFLERWLPSLVRTNRSYVTIAIGCTGGQHRSVYLAERLAATFDGRFGRALLRHRDLEDRRHR